MKKEVEWHQDKLDKMAIQVKELDKDVKAGNDEEYDEMLEEIS